MRVYISVAMEGAMVTRWQDIITSGQAAMCGVVAQDPPAR